MRPRVLVVGLDCLGPEVLTPRSLADLPTLRSLVEGGRSGPLTSTLPPITVPAWSSMMTGRDPGELGVYGFRNRTRFDYTSMAYADARHVRFPRIWDFASSADLRSIVVGVPQTFPAPRISGALVSGFEAEGATAGHTHPAALAEELGAVAGSYRFDVTGFRERDRGDVWREIVEMTERRFTLMRHLMDSRPWDFAMLCEIGPDRLHHCFWSDHDPAHPRHDPQSPYRNVIREYYGLLDSLMGSLLRALPNDTQVAVVSDHGARPMEGGVFVNEVLREAGWLHLAGDRPAHGPLDPACVDWSRTRAWALGGYYARVFLNIEGREPHGVVPFEQRDQARAQLEDLLGNLELPGGPVLASQVLRPERIYRRVRGLPPDLLVFFGGGGWRSLGSVGHGRLWQVGNDTGVDQANHARDGMYVLRGSGVATQRGTRASILDVAPTLLQWLEIDAPSDLQGRSMLLAEAVA